MPRLSLARLLDILLILALATYVLLGVPLTPFHADEATQIAMSRDFFIQFVDGDYDRLRYDPIRSMPDVLRCIAPTDLVVATRFHNLVAALIQHKPMISVGYAEKNDALMQSVGLGEFCQHVDRFDLARLQEQFGRMVADWRRYRAQVADHQRRFHECSLRQLDEILGPGAG